MGPDEQQRYHDEANLEPLRVRLPQPTATEEHTAKSSSPWGLGSSVYPAAAESVKIIVQRMLPEGKQWVREAYEKVRDSTDPDGICNCIVQNTEPPLDLNKLRRHRNAEATCFQAHPGLCVCAENKSSIVAFHQLMRTALRSFNLSPDACGDALFLFCGYRRKTHARRAERRFQEQDVENVSADEFELAFLSDEPDRRKGLKVFTRCHCRIDDEGRFNFGCHAGLVETAEHTLDERIGHGFSKLLRDRCRYWICFLVAYEDTEEELHVIKVPRF